jgi:hypothetical protein
LRARGLFRLWVCSFCVLIALTTISACVPHWERNQPLIALDPTGGGPGTSVVVIGRGFPAETRVSVRLGPPSVGATPQSYADATTDPSGGFVLSFTIPAQWPDSTPISVSQLVVVVLNDDASAKATAPFAYVPVSSAAR